MLVFYQRTMISKPQCPVIAIEEHYWDAELAAHYQGIEAARDPEASKRLHDLGALRLREMDEGGIDVQVLSHGAPSTQKLPADMAADLTRRVNDRLFAGISRRVASARSYQRLSMDRWQFR